MSAELQERYDMLRDDFEKLASAVADFVQGGNISTLIRLAVASVPTQDPDIAADMAAICETFACGVLDRHPKGARRGGLES